MALLTPDCFLKVDERHPKTGTVFQMGGARTYERVFLVEMNHQNWGVLEVSLAPGLPSAYSPYMNVYTGFFDGLALLTEATCNRLTPTGRVWEVVCKYTTAIPRHGPIGVGLPVKKDGGQGGGAENNPDLEPPEVEWDFEEVQVPARRDLNGQAFVNSAWQELTPTPTIPYYRPIYTITRNELFFDIILASEIAGTVNDSALAGYPMDSILCMAPKAHVAYKGGFRYVKTTYRFKFGYQKENGLFESFQHEELDHGTRERLPAYDDVGNPIMDPEFPDQQVQQYIPIYEGSKVAKGISLLNGDGRKQKKWATYGQDPGVGQTPDDINLLYALKPVYLHFKTRRRINMKKLWEKGFPKQSKFIGDPITSGNVFESPT